MGRPPEEGLPWFKLRTDIDADDKVFLVEAEFGEKGIVAFGIVIKLFMRIYRERGYFFEADDRSLMVFCKRKWIDFVFCKRVIDVCLSENVALFDRGLFDRYRILTSKGIQTRYFSVRRTAIKYDPDLMLIDVSAYKNLVSVRNNKVFTGESTQIREDKIRGDNKKAEKDFSFSLDAVEKKQEDGSKSADVSKVDTTANGQRGKLSGNDKPDAVPGFEHSKRSTTVEAIANEQHGSASGGRDLKDILFDDFFWRNYPEKNGKKVGRTKAKALCLKLNVFELCSRCIASKNYKESKRLKGGIAPKDPVGFLEDGYWKDWLAPEEGIKEKSVVYIHAVKPVLKTEEERKRTKEIFEKAKADVQNQTGRKVFRKATVQT